MIPSYEQHFRTILRGNLASPRGKDVHEVYNATLLLRPGEMPGRKNLNYRLGIMEGLQFIAGIFRPDWIGAVAPNARLDLFTHQAAYGPRAVDQLPHVERALRRDRTSRQAVIVLAREDEVGTSELPCTTAMQFQIRNHRLTTTVIMRSSDAVWGLPYDVVQFGMLAQTLGKVLKAEASTLVLHIGNAHVYADTQHLAPNNRGGEFGVTEAPRDWFEAQDWAAEAAECMAAGRAPDGVVWHAA